MDGAVDFLPGHADAGQPSDHPRQGSDPTRGGAAPHHQPADASPKAAPHRWRTERYVSLTPPLPPPPHPSPPRQGSRPTGGGATPHHQPTDASPKAAPHRRRTERYVSLFRLRPSPAGVLSCPWGGGGDAPPKAAAHRWRSYRVVYLSL